MSYKFRLTGTVSLFALFAPLSQAAQTDEVVEEIEVTGTRLGQIGAGKLLPVLEVDRAVIEATGAFSADEVFRTLPMSDFVGFQNQNTVGGVNSVRGDAASVNLRGLGTGNTLLLMNGRRMVMNPTFQTEALVPVMTPNANSLPLDALSSLRVLKDGGSAIYGADAVAGVVDAQFTNDVDGVTLKARYGLSDGTDYHEADFSVKAGDDFAGGRGHVSLYASYSRANSVRTSARDYAASSDMRRFLEGTPFEGDGSFNMTNVSSPWAELDIVQNVVPTLNGTPITNSSGVFHIQPATNSGCVAQLSGGICIDDGTLSSSDSADGDRNLFYDIMSGWTLIPKVERVNALALVDYEISDDISFYGEAAYYGSSSVRNREPASMLSNARVIVPKENYWNPLGATTLADGSPNPNRIAGLVGVPDEGLDVALRNYRITDTGERTIDADADSYRLLAGLKGTLGSWNWDSAALYSRATTTDITHNRISNTLLQAALADNTPNAYNPFNGGSLNNPSVGDDTPSPAAALDRITIDVRRKGIATLAMGDIHLTNDALFQLPAGGVGLSVGGEVRRESYSDDRDDRLDGTIIFTDMVSGAISESDVVSSSPTADTGGNRTVTSAYGELAVPLVSPDMNIPLVEAATLQFAGRFEHFSDVGDTWTPKVAGAWTVTSGLTFRASWSEGFRAPNLVQIHDAGVSRVNNRLDYVRCDALVQQGQITGIDQCAATGTLSTRSGSETLQPEKSENTSIGLLIEPVALPGFRFSIDRWTIRQTGIVGVFGDQNHLALDYLRRLQGSSNPDVVRAAPTAADIALFVGTGLTPAGEVLSVADTYVNMDARRVAGIDISASYRHEMQDGATLDLSVNASRYTKFEQEAGERSQQLLDAVAAGDLPGDVTPTGFGDILGLDGRAKWRWNANLAYARGPWSAGLFATYIGSFRDTTSVNDETGDFWKVDSWLTLNASLGYAFTADNWLKDTAVKLSVTNLLDEDPPLAPESFGFHGSMHNPKGRMIYLTLTKGF
ncbi:TonB-dependent receptor plug domain-containing protein [Pseudokordiimonas caeni]|uniref:TonB-dependent receptor plug domain-containing protein n=1 Tax=Pseudokordiimonas caeni TaxID=2997908 RepID=UPI002811B0D1|nr:TonB-dependent receptor [Pseudokordiimonas caeni]